MSDSEQYRTLVRKLNYLTVTRLDISFPISVVSQFLKSSCEDHWNAVIRILKYIKRSLEKGLLYGSNNHTRVVCYSDADWTRSLSDRRSTSEYCIIIGGNLISSKSTKQSDSPLLLVHWALHVEAMGLSYTWKLLSPRDGLYELWIRCDY